ncbi:TAP-like protein [Allokutzneria albata]|uniref:TAP-like protein n=1 Tax=Allokutzneria albata TaxID=211114 RepID=A0A1G9U3J2_ALLAB|nr:TAP-like protein [Allokutzneria albata]
MAVALAVGTALVPGSPVSAAAEGLDWQPCAQDRTAECSALTLPVDWAAPSGETFPLAVARRRAADPRRRIGVLLVNPGGPGASGVRLALGSPGLFGPEVLARFDIVGFDPRGVAGSRPIRCSAALLAQGPRHAPRDQAEFDRLAAHNQRLREDCRDRTGALTDHADTLSVVRDMDALRAALGETKINFFGASYGTLIGAQYASRFGDRVRAMVLDGSMDHSLSLDRFLTSAAANGEDALSEFARWCERESGCAWHGRPVLPRWAELMAAADAGRLVESDGATPVSADYLVNRAYGALIRPEPAAFASWLASLRTGTASPAHNARQRSQDLLDHPRPSVFCQDWTPRVTSYREWQVLEAAQRRAAPNLRYSPEAQEAALSCVGWPAKAANPPGPANIGPGDPILLVNPLHDPATGHSWALLGTRIAPAGAAPDQPAHLRRLGAHRLSPHRLRSRGRRDVPAGT